MMTDHANLLKVVRSVARRWRFRVLLRGAGILLLSTVALLVVAGYAVDASRFDATTLAVARVLGGLALLAVGFLALIRPLARRISDERAALYLEEHEPSLGGRVISAVDHGRQPGRPGSPGLGERQVGPGPPAWPQGVGGKRVERSGLWRSASVAVASGLLGLGLLGTGPSFLQRTTPLLLDPWQDLESVNPYRVQVEPGDATVARGADLRVTATLEGFDAADVELSVRGGEAGDGAEGVWRRWPMLEEDGTHSLIIFDLKAATEYFVEARGVRSPIYRIAVLELPYVEKIDLTYRFPAYTGLEPLAQDASGDVAALVGTVVELEVTSTLPVTGGAIELEGEPVDGEAGASTLPLTVGEDGLLSGSFTVSQPGRYRILLEGPEDKMAPASPDYLIDPLSDQPPIISLGKPGRDIQASNLEEVALEVQARDDYGVSRLELVYAVGGGEEQVVSLYRDRPGRKDLSRGHTLFLEELERPGGDQAGEGAGGMLRPGDLVSYYARAVDASGSEAVTDIYFLEIRPFDRNYRQADQAGMPGAQGMSGAELTAQQRMIIAATFKLKHGIGSPVPGEAVAGARATGDVATVALSQGRLREQVEVLIERLGESDAMISDRDDSPVATMTRLLPQAAAEMATAEQALGELHPDRALAPEQRALQLLQRAEAGFTDVQVTEGQQGGGGGGGDIREELADLFDQERDRLRNQYEQVQRGELKRRDDAIDETLEKLRELARRQQQENERRRARARHTGQQASAGASGRSQRQLAEETEEVARKLERLARQQASPELEETARRLREAAEEMRRAAAAGEQTGESLAGAALDRLRQARAQLESGKSGRIERDTRDAIARARRLREQQRRMIERVDRLDPDDAEALGAIQQSKEAMGAEVGEIEAAIDRTSRDARRDQPEASRRLEQAAGEIRDRKIREKILYSRGVVEQRSKEYARNFEEHIEGTLGQLEQRLVDAARAMGESREQRLERALDKARDAVTGLESLEARLRSDRGQGPGDGEGQSDRQGRSGAGPPPTGAERGGNPLAPRQFRRELGQRAAELESLRRDLGAEGVDTTDLAAIIGRLRELGSNASGPETLAALEADVVRGLKEFEFALRRSLAPADDARALQAASDDVPEGFEDLVNRYYQALAGEER